jgi:methylmalonyl-CoA/ethylmalonyl-CoA epimerase
VADHLTILTGSDVREGRSRHPAEEQVTVPVATWTPPHPSYDDDAMTAPSKDLSIPEHLFVAIDHVGVAVPDLDEAMAFYRDVYGMKVLHEETNEEQGVREAMVGVGDSGSCIQLLAPLDEKSTIAKFLDRNGPGMQQLAYRVTDVEQVAKILNERGVRTLYDAPKRGTSDSRVNFLHPKDAGGVLVELVEPAKGATAH